MYMFGRCYTGKHKVVWYRLQVGTSSEKVVRKELCGASTIRLRLKGSVRFSRFKGQRQTWDYHTACSEQSQLHRVLAVGPFKELRTRNLRTASEEREVKLTPLSMDIPLYWFLETFP